jgi:hypothetical protein
MPHIPSQFSPTSLPKQPLGGNKPPVPYLGSKKGESNPITSKRSSSGPRMVSKLNPINWKYDTDRVLRIMYPEMEWNQDEHTRGLVHNHNPNT